MGDAPDKKMPKDKPKKAKKSGRQKTTEGAKGAPVKAKADAPTTTTADRKKVAIAAADNDSDMDRRNFFLKVGWGSFALYFMGLGGCMAKFFFPRVLFEPPTLFKAGSPSEYSVGEVSTRFKEAQRVWIVRGPTRFFVIYALCTHLGCTPNWNESNNKFKCPCHGSGYTREGINFEGPAPRPMERCKVTLSPSGSLLIDTSVRFRPEKWEQEPAYLSYA